MLLLIALLLSTGLHAEPAPLPAQPEGIAWPTASWPEGPRDARVDERRLEDAVERITAPIGRGGLPDTRAVLIVQRGRVVFERYAEGFAADSRFHSWSMAKSVTQALIAILVREQKLALDARAPVPEWQDPKDPRHAITLRNILNMSTGLDNADGGGGPNSFVGRLFFGDLHRDTAHAAASVPLLHDPGTHWAYASSMGGILGRVIADQVGGGPEATLAFMRKELFDPLGVK